MAEAVQKSIFKPLHFCMVCKANRAKGVLGVMFLLLTAHFLRAHNCGGSYKGTYILEHKKTATTLMVIATATIPANPSNTNLL